jgi:DNA-binding NarL/FixJ family response regulator
MVETRNTTQAGAGLEARPRPAHAPALGARRRGDRVNTARIRVLIAVPQLMLRQALAAVLASAPDVQLLGAVGNTREALRWALASRPDVTLLDEQLGRLDGCDVTSLLHEEDRTLRLVTLADPGRDPATEDTAAAARLSKGQGTDALLDVLRRVARGERPGCVADPNPSPLMAPEPHQEHLTGAERTLLEYLADGATNRELADLTSCGEKTVRNRLTLLYAKLGLRNRTQAALYAVRTGIVTLPRRGGA